MDLAKGLLRNCPKQSLDQAGESSVNQYSVKKKCLEVNVSETDHVL